VSSLTTRVIVRSVLAALLLAGLGACSSSSGPDDIERALNDAIREELGDEAGISIDGGRFTVTDGENEVTMFGGEMPDGFPPFPEFQPGAVPIVAQGLVDGDEQRYAISYMFERPAADAEAFYTDALPAAGWTITDSQGGLISIEGHGYTGGVWIVSNADDGATVNINLEGPLR
jgi:hypothetical protein